MPAFTSRRRHGGRWWGIGTTAAAAVVALLFVALAGAAKPVQPAPPNGPWQVPTGPVGQASGFADSDGNTTATNSSSDYNPATSSTNVANQPSYDWNSLTGGTNPTYSGTAPYQSAGGTTAATTNAGNGWLWLALTDAQKSNTDTGFAGGVKEDDNCPAVVGGSAPNKDDLKRAYFAATTLTAGARAGHTILNLGWVRIPQNTTSPSAHIAFEFNQNSTDATTGSPCGGNSDGLVNRHAGDLLVLYDFTGGASIPTITIDRWVTSGACDVSSHSAPCWGPGTTLTGTQAEANVDTGLSHVCDTHSSPTPSGTFCDPGEVDTSDGTTFLGSKYVLPFQTSDSLAPSTDTLAASEFGEAGIDLTAALIFTSDSCVSFGRVNAVSRTSGDSGTAAMEDLVGPGQFSLSNCSTSTSTTPQSDGTGSTAGNFSNMTQDSTTKTWGTLAAGTWVRDTATVSVTGTSTWSGSVDFYLCHSTTQTLTTCNSTDGTAEGTDVAVSDSGATANSDSLQVSAGSYCWAAYFTASSPTGLPDGDPSLTLECFTVKGSPSAGSAPSLIPNDKVTVSGLSTGGSVSGTADQKMTVSLYGPGDTDCTAATPLFKQTFTVTANGDYSTTNDGNPNNQTLAGYTISPSGTPPALASTIYHWGVVYNGDSFNNGFSFCKTTVNSVTTFDETVTVAIKGK